MIPVHAKYKSRGFEAIGVSLDQARSTWVGVIEQRGMSYPNVSQLQGWDSPIVKDYKITATPTYFLLDSEGKQSNHSSKGEVLESPPKASDTGDIANPESKTEHTLSLTKLANGRLAVKVPGQQPGPLPVRYRHL